MAAGDSSAFNDGSDMGGGLLSAVFSGSLSMFEETEEEMSERREALLSLKLEYVLGMMPLDRLCSWLVAYGSGEWIDSNVSV